MKITTVEYRRLVSQSDYSNATIGATAAVEGWDLAEDTFRDLKAWVDQQISEYLSAKGEIYDTQNELSGLRSTVREYRRVADLAKARWADIAIWAEANGLTVERPRVFDDDPDEERMPF